MPNSSDLKNCGLKVTAPRMKILKLFEQHDIKHLSAEDIVSFFTREGESISLATVYRVLHQFEEAGLLVRHKFDDDHAVYELNEGKHHDHIVCVKCQKVEEFCDPVIESHQETVAKQMGYTLTDHAMTLYGVCRSCLD